MTLGQAIVLGIVQGLAEFLPISSSAHLILVPWFFGWPDPGLSYDVILHLGTLLAVLMYFAGDLFRLGRAGVASLVELRIGFDRNRQWFWWIILGTIPAGLLGLLFHDFVEQNFRAPLLIAMSLASVGLLMYWADEKSTSLKDADELTWKDVLWIGFGQACALVPGVSRSGATITVARLLGYDRNSAARFSFLLSVPITAAAGLHEVKKIFEVGQLDVPAPALIAGFLTSFLFGLLGIHVLLRVVRFSNLARFAWYRIALAALVVLWSLFSGR
jgi:undecaprenyl-diphosphatase